MATPLICLKISPENAKQLSVKTSSAKRSSVSVEGSNIEVEALILSLEGHP